jgi:hypothetical protein
MRITRFLIGIVILIIIFAAIYCKKESPVTPSPESDSTSHSITWQIDTIGTWQSFLFSVWGTDSKNIYAIGGIFDPDTGIHGTSIMHWDGNKWKPENFWEGDMCAIFGFSTNDIWVAGDNGVKVIIGHWDGVKWTKVLSSINGWIRGLWGTSSKNLFAVGGGGMILHFNGTTWSEMFSGTNIHLWDIWGFSDHEIYASGYDDSIGKGVLLFFNGSSWQKLYENTKQDSIPSGVTTTVWGYDTAHVYIWTSSSVYLGNRNKWNGIEIPNENVFIQRIRGSSQKNIFVIGHFSMIIHWNGKNWNRYNEFFRFPHGDVLYGCFVLKDQVFIVGRSETARGIVYRGTINN